MGKNVGDFSRTGFNDRAPSVSVDQVLKSGSHEALGWTRLENPVSSVRPVNAELLSAASLGHPIGDNAATTSRSP
jgi:hypothetical protein